MRNHFDHLSKQIGRGALGPSVLAVLRVRGIAVPDAARERILAQRDLEQLKRWLEKAIVASSIGEVFDGPR